MRLNQAIREEIIKKAIKNSSARKTLDELLKQQADFVEACRIESLGGEKVAASLKRDLAAMRKRASKYPDGVIEVHGPLRVDLMIVNQGRRRWFSLAGELPSSMEFYVDKNRKLKTEMDRLMPLIDDAKKAVASLRGDLTSTIYSVNTTKQLIEMWPEAEELIPASVAKKVVGLPAVPIGVLNERVGLPMKKGKAA